MKYLVLKKTEGVGMLKIVWEFDGLQKAVSYLLTHNLVAEGLIVKVIEHF